MPRIERVSSRKGGMGDNVSYRLSSAVFFSEIGEEVYLRDVDRRTDMLLSRSASPILNALRGVRSLADLVGVLTRKYDIKSNAKIKSDVEQFVSSLVACGVVEKVCDKSPECVGVEPMLKSKTAGNNRLWAVTLELTYRCNEKCIHCYLDTSKIAQKKCELKAEDWKRVIDQCYELGCFKVLVTGGEPTLYPDFLSICKYVIGKGMLLDIYSNGLAISDDLFDELKVLKFNSFSVSLYGPSNFHDEITKVKGSFEKTFKTAMMLKCAGKDVYVKSVLFHRHLKDYFELKKMCERVGISVKPSIALLPGRSGCTKASLALSDSELLRFAHCENAGGCMADLLGRMADGPVCMAGQNQIAINPFGEVYPCVALPISVGNVKSSTISEIWDGAPELKKIQGVRLIDVGEKCKSCSDLNACSICLGTVLKQEENCIRIVNAKYVCHRVHLQTKNRKDR